MNKIIQIGNIFPTKTRENPNQGRVYSVGGQRFDRPSSMGFSYGIVVKSCGREFCKSTEISNCIMARDYKGLGNQEMTAILEGEE